MLELLFGLFCITIGGLQLFYPARFVRERGMGSRRRLDSFRPERFGCFNLLVSGVVIIVGLYIVMHAVKALISP
ncbi:MAG: hypothetical protein H0Z39_03310 [Peptococcaceae bacterium]|nr:hypothetical protein [Peptococcaceae bacterium]